MPSPLRHAPLAAFWLLFFAEMGVLFPFTALYLRENAALPRWQVGLVLAVPPLVGLLSQPFWGQIADRTGARSRVLVVLAAGASAALLLFPRLEGFAALFGGICLVAVFQGAIVPTLTSVTFGALEGSRRWFGLIRMWGTVGFACLVLGFPPVLAAVQHRFGLVAVPGGPSEPGLAAIFVVAAGLNVAAAFVALALPRTGSVALRAPRGDWRRLLRHGPYVRVLAFVFCSFFVIHGPMSLFPVYVRSLGGDLGALSRAWLFMLALEIPLVIAAPFALSRVDARALLCLGLLAGGARWTACGLLDDLALVYPVQLLHALTVAGLLMGGPLYVDAVVPARLRSTGQGVLAMTGAGLGAMASTAATGWAMEVLGERAPYLIGGIAGLALGAAAFALLPSPVPPDPEGEHAPLSVS